MTRYFEDLRVGHRESFGTYSVTREEVIDFAGKYDPQPFHLSDEGAIGTAFGSLAASGWHTASMMMAMMVRHWQQTPGGQEASLGAIGVDELRWLRPCYPGDLLRGETELIEKIPSKSRPEMGIIKTKISVFNQKDEVVMTLVPIAMWRTRPA